MGPAINQPIPKEPRLSVEEERSLLTAVNKGIPKEKLLEVMDEQTLNGLIHDEAFEVISSTQLRPQKNDIEDLIRKVTKKDCDKILSFLKDYKKSLDKLTLSNIGLVKTYAHSYASIYANMFEKPMGEFLEDLTQEGITGLIIAIKKFNPKDRMDIPKSMFLEADPNGALVLESVIKKGIYSEVSPTEVRLNRAAGEFKGRPPEMVGKNFNKIWSQSLYSLENRLSTYAVPYIKYAMIQFLREESSIAKLTNYAHKIKNTIYLAEERLKIKLGRKPTDKELAQKTGLSEEQVHKFRRLFIKSISIDAFYEAKEEANDAEVSFHGIDLDKHLSDVDATHELPMRNFLTKEVAMSIARELDAREKRMIEMQYGLKDGKPATGLGVMAKEFKISKARVSQIGKGILKKIAIAIKRTTVKSAEKKIIARSDNIPRTI